MRNVSGIGWFILLLILLQPVIAKDTVQNKNSWANLSPEPYSDPNSELIKQSYKENWAKSTGDKNTEVVIKAKLVLKEWGRDPEKFEYESKYYKHKITVHESKNFLSVIFKPIDLPVTCHQVEIRFAKKGLKVLSILPGS